MATNKPRISGPGMVEVGRDGKLSLSKRLVDVILDLYERVYSAQTTADEAAVDAATAESAISITGTNGITVFGDADSGFTVQGPGTASGGGAAPLLVDEDTIYTVSANAQVLFHFPIQIDGVLVVDGILVEV